VKPIRITFNFDTEDYINPPELGIDDLIKALADAMTEGGTTGNFFMIGEKMRNLKDRGRDDVIAAISQHDVGSHVNLGSLHPTLTERMERADWHDGVARMVADEIAGLREIAAISGRPARTLALHGGSYAPQLANALGRFDAMLINTPATLPDHPITWFCNTLNFGQSQIAFQQHYYSREIFEKKEQQFFEEVERWPYKEWFPIFHSHPTFIKMQKSPCRHYYKGVHTEPGEYEVGDVRTDFTSTQAVFENYRYHCQRLRDDPRFRVLTFSQMAEEFGQQAAAAGRRELAALAQQAASADAPFYTDRFSAAEIVDLLARAYLHRTAHGELPDALPRRDVLGPSQTPLATPGARRLAPRALQRIALGIDSAVALTGAVPSRFHCGEGPVGTRGEVGLGSALIALGQALADADVAATVTPRPAAPYPAAGADIADRARARKKWNPHRLDLDMAEIVRLTALQTWSVKPAWPGEPPAHQ
jgi:hypothetical protein